MTTFAIKSECDIVWTKTGAIMWPYTDPNQLSAELSALHYISSYCCVDANLRYRTGNYG